MADVYVKDFKGTSDTTAQITVVNVSSPNTIIEPALFPEGGNKESELVVGTGTRPKAGQESVFTFKGLVKGKKYQVWLYNRSHRDGEICDDGEYTPDSCGYYGSTVTESGETLWVTFNGLAITPKLYAPVDAKTKKVARFYVPVSNKIERCGKLYASVEGKTRLVSRFVTPSPPPPKPTISMVGVYYDEGVMVSIGDQLMYEIKYSNNTAAEIADVKILVSHLNADWVESSIEPTINEADTATFSLGSLSSGDSGTFTFTIMVRDDSPLSVTDVTNGFVLTVSAEVYSDGQDGDTIQITNPVPGLNETYIEQPESATASGKPTLKWKEEGILYGDTAYIGSEITYSIKYMNGHKDKQPVYIIIGLDQGTDYDENGSSTNFTYNERTHSIVAQINDVPGGSGGSETFKVKVLERALPFGFVSMQATIRVGNDISAKTIIIENPATWAE